MCVCDSVLATVMCIDVVGVVVVDCDAGFAVVIVATVVYVAVVVVVGVGVSIGGGVIGGVDVVSNVGEGSVVVCGSWCWWWCCWCCW